MKHAAPSLARLVAWSALLLGLLVAGCEDPTPPPAVREVPDADRSSVSVSRTAGVRADGKDSVAIQVTVLNADGAPMSGRTVTVAVSGEGNTVTQSAGPTDAQGVASASLTSTTVGLKTVTASVQDEGGAVTLSARPTVEFILLPASKLAFTQVPTSGTAGDPLGTFEVSLQDAEGVTVAGAQPTVTLKLGAGPEATLLGTSTATAVGGVARFTGLRIEKAAKGYTLVASAPGLPEVTSSPFEVLASAPASFTLAPPGVPLQAGTGGTFGLSVFDAYGNLATAYTGTVHFTSDDALAQLPADFTFSAADAGHRDFEGIALTQAGSRRVTVKDTVLASLTDTVEVAVLPGAAAKLAFSQQPLGASVRAPFGVQVQVTDALGNVVSSPAVSVSLALNKSGTLTGAAPVTTADGVARFSGLSIAQDNTGYVLTASASGLLAAQSTGFTITDDVAPAAPVLSLTTATATSLTVGWAAVGDDGNLGTATSYELRYSMLPITSEADFLAALPVALPGAPQAPGSAESVTISSLMQLTTYYVALKVTDNAGTATRSATLTASTPSPTASRLVFSQQPTSGTAGSVLAPIKVEIQDASGLVDLSASTAVTLTVFGTSGYGPFTVTADKGVATFTNVRIDTAGTGYTLRASAPPLPTAISTTFDIAPAAASQFLLNASAGPFTAGQAFPVAVVPQDAYGNAVKTYRGTVHLSSSDPQAVLPPDAAFTSGDADGKSFSVTLKTAGSQSVTVQDTAVATLKGTLTRQIDAGVATKLVFQSQPASAKVRASLGSVTVAITDAFDNLLPVNTPAITVGLVMGNPAAVLGGTLTVTPVSGVATFSGLSVDQQGTDFRLEAMGTALNMARSQVFIITDDIAPGGVTLSLGTLTSTTVQLSWLAVGDDGLLGTASAYDLRYATSPITEATFGSATPVTVGTPKASGSAESAAVGGLSASTLYYFALQVLDDAGNSSFATTSATTTSTDPCAGVTCTADAPTCAADGVSLVTFTAACAVEGEVGTCKQTPVTTSCSGIHAVCYQAACDTAAVPEANQIVLSEVMHSPSMATQYIELSNRTATLLDLNGVTVSYTNSASAESTFTLGSGSVPVVVGRNGTYVLARNKNLATNGGVSADTEYPGSFTLESTGQLGLFLGETQLDFVAYTPSFPQTVGRAMSLSSRILGTYASAYPWYWCDAETALTGGDYGTPNAANGACGVTSTPALDFCAIQSPKTLPSTVVDTATPITSRFHGTGVTDRNHTGNDLYPFVFAELGYGPVTGSAASWTWTPILPNGAYAATTDDDETRGVLKISTPGSYRYGFRYSFKDASGTSAYTYCDQNGIADPTGGTFGTVTIITSTPPPATNHVVISEVALAGPGGANDEFFELYNPTSAEVNLAGWKVQYKSVTGTSYTNSATLPAGAKIAAHGYYLVASTSYVGTVTPDYKLTGNLSFGGVNGHVRIGNASVSANITDTNAVDTLGYGTGDSPEGSAFTPSLASPFTAERKAYSTSTDASMASGGADATKGNAYDSDNNAMDFVVRASRDPQNSASALELP